MLFPIAAAPHAETGMREVVSHPDYSLWDARFSPDERWVCFAAVGPGESGVTTIYLLSRAGGEWSRITEGRALDRYPRWSPDGKTIYFVSDRTGFFNVWGIRLDPAQMKPLGQPFRVTAFDSPAKSIAVNASFPNELDVGNGRLVVSLTEVSGNVWMLENFDR